MGQLVARVGTGLLLLLAGVSEARAQDDTSTSPATQIWASLTFGRTVSERTYLELDIEPKWQVTSGEEWRNIDFTPLAEYYPTSWLDLEAEGTVGRTRQRDGLDTFEVTPRIGARLHLFKQIVSGRKRERLPLTRISLSSLVRLEWRNFVYSDDTPSSHEWRARLGLEGKLAISHKTLSQDRTLYAIGDAEYYAPLSDDIPERYVNKLRGRSGSASSSLLPHGSSSSISGTGTGARRMPRPPRRCRPSTCGSRCCSEPMVESDSSRARSQQTAIGLEW